MSGERSESRQCRCQSKHDACYGSSEVTGIAGRRLGTHSVTHVLSQMLAFRSVMSTNAPEAFILGPEGTLPSSWSMG